MKLYSVLLATGRDKSVRVEPIEATNKRHAIAMAKEIVGNFKFIQCERLSALESAFYLEEEPEAIHHLCTTK